MNLISDIKEAKETEKNIIKVTIIWIQVKLEKFEIVQKFIYFSNST